MTKMHIFIKSLLVVSFSLFIYTQRVNAISSSINIPNTYMDVSAAGGMVALNDGKVWIAEGLNSRIVKVDPVANTVLRKVGRAGTGDGEFSGYLISMTQDNEGNLYGLTMIGSVTKMDSNGGFIARYDVSLGGGETRDIAYDSYTDSFLISNLTTSRVERFSKNFTYVSGFGGYGTGEGQFDAVTGLATDANGKIYVSDHGNARVEVFDFDYHYLFEIKNWTDETATPRSFVNVQDIIVQSDGYINVVSLDTQNVIQFTSNGTYTRNFGNNQLIAPSYITRDSSNNLYVSDVVRSTIFKYNSNGVLQDIFGNGLNEPGKLSNPGAIKYNSAGHAFVLDSTGRVQEFDSDGSYITTIISAGQVGGDAYFMTFAPDGKLVISNNNGFMVFALSDGLWGKVFDYNDRGSGEGQFNYATGLAFDGSGNMFVCDFYNNRIHKFNSSYAWLSTIDNGHSDPLLDGQVDWPQGLAIDAADNLYVASSSSIQKLNSTGTYISKIGVGDYATPSYVSVIGGVIYISDANSDSSARVHTYSVATGENLDTIGSYGNGQMQFIYPADTSINPISGLLSIVDSRNNRVITLSEGNRILNLISSANVIRTDTGHEGESLSNRTWVPSGGDTLIDIPARMIFGDYVVADFTVDLSEGDLDWSLVNVQTLPRDSKSLVVNLNITDAPGISSTHSLYLARYANQTSVTVCPQANTLDSVVLGCDGEYVLNEGDADISSVTIGIQNYWKIDGLTGTGAFSTLFETSYSLSDLMTRQKVGVGSNHEITFGTTYSITHDGDTITIGFDPEWDLHTIGIGNLVLKRDDTVLPLVANLEDPAADDTWGVYIDYTLNNIVFTAPTNADASIWAIAEGSIIKVLINGEVLLNPAAAASYQITMFNVTAGIVFPDVNSEIGSVEVPIVDSDTVDITGYISAFMHFDIDTGTGEVPGVNTAIDCNYAAPNACLTHQNGAAGTNYTVDLGELTSLIVNKSNDTSPMHSQGGAGLINSIYFDLTTNSPSGAVVTVKSLNGGLQGPAENKISSITSGQDITANTGKYGYNLPVASDQVGGTVVKNPLCDAEGIYCGPSSSATTEVFSTNSLPVDGARVRMDIAAAASYTNSPGNYTDTLTFVATSTF